MDGSKKKQQGGVNRRGRYWYDHEMFSEWVHILGGKSAVAKRLGLSDGTVERYCKGQTPIPTSIYVFLELLCTGQLALGMGKQWNDILLTPGGLQLPGWRRPFTPTELHSLFVLLNGRRIIESQLNIAKKDLAKALQDAEEWEEKARFYRNQLVLESKMGLMLARVSDVQ
jgi:hypothetical protein